jgi:hypothetical protein
LDRYDEAELTTSFGRPQEFSSLHESSMPLATTIALGIGVLLVVGLFALGIRKAIQRRTFSGFLGALTHPVAIMAWAKAQRAAIDEALESAKSWSNDEVTAAVRKYVLETQDASLEHSSFLILRSLGERTHEPIIALLRDRSLHQELVAHDDEINPPLQRACQLLANKSDARVLELLGSSVKDHSTKVRRAVADAIAMQGSIESLPYVQSLLDDEDDDVRSCAMDGLIGAAYGNRLDPALGEGLFDRLTELVETDPSADNAARSLLRIDRERAAKLLMSEKYFDAAFSKLFEVLRAFRMEKVRVPRDRLKFLLDRLASVDLGIRRNARCVGETLELLAEYADISDRPYFERYLDNSAKWAARGAVAGLLKLADMADFESNFNGKEYEDLTLVQRRYFAVRNMDAEVLNGGFSQFFFNPAGDLWRDALDGLQIMGMKERASLLATAVVLFGEVPPSEIRSTRMEQLSNVVREKGDPFDDLCSRYYASKEVVVAALARYVLANEAEFR